MTGWLGMTDMIGNPVTAILLMAMATYFCRFIGFWIVSFMQVGYRTRRAFEVLPGCIAAATAFPIAIDSGPVAITALAVGFGVMRFVKIEVVALIAALGLVAGSRAFGL